MVSGLYRGFGESCEGDTLHLGDEKGSCSAEIYICVTVFV